MKKTWAAGIPAMAAVAMAWTLSAQQPEDQLWKAFQHPLTSARPRVWWHWMNGNITEDGIRKDLEWMSRVGIGGLQNFDAALNTPPIVEKRLVYMTPEWKAAFRYAASVADSLGLELAIAASPGWSETGGPWVEPRDGMKKLVRSDHRAARPPPARFIVRGVPASGRRCRSDGPSGDVGAGWRD